MLGLVGAHDVLVPGRRKRKGAGFRTEAPAVVVGLGGLFDDDMEDHEEGCLQHDACIPSHATSVPRVGSVRVVCSTMPAYNHAKLSAAHQRTFAISASRIQEHPTLASSVPRIEAECLCKLCIPVVSCSFLQVAQRLNGAVVANATGKMHHHRGLN